MSPLQACPLHNHSVDKYAFDCSRIRIARYLVREARYLAWVLLAGAGGGGAVKPAPFAIHCSCRTVPSSEFILSTHGDLASCRLISMLWSLDGRKQVHRNYDVAICRAVMSEFEHLLLVRAFRRTCFRIAVFKNRLTICCPVISTDFTWVWGQCINTNSWYLPCRNFTADRWRAMCYLGLCTL